MARISEETLIRLYGTRVSERRLERITEALWGEKMTPDTLKALIETICKQVEEWRCRQLSDEYPYVYLTKVMLRRGRENKRIPVLVALGVNTGGFRDIIGVCKGSEDDAAGWLSFLRYLEDRGLVGARLFISDDYPGLSEAIDEVFPEAKHQRCIVNFNLDMFKLSTADSIKPVADILSGIYAQRDKAKAVKKAKEAVDRLEGMELFEAAELLEENVEKILAYMSFPEEHWNRLRTDNSLERAMLEVIRRNSKVDSFPDDETAVMSICAGLRHIPYVNWRKRYMSVVKTADALFLPSVS